MSKSKYVPVKISGVVIGIGETTEVEGYTETIIETFIPDPTEFKNDAEALKWTTKNNKRMEAICKFLNENDL